MVCLEVENKKKVVNLTKYRGGIIMDSMINPIERGIITKKTEKNPSKILDIQFSLQSRISDLYDQLISNTNDFNLLRNSEKDAELKNKTLQITWIEKNILQLEEKLEKNNREFELISKAILKDEQVQLSHYLTNVDKEIQKLQLQFIKAFDSNEYKSLYNKIELLKIEKSDYQRKLRIIESKLTSNFPIVNQ